MTQQGQIATPYFPYTVQPGDTLSGIAQQAYNDGSQPYWMAIYRMNQDKIGNDPNVISPGTSLWIPRFAATPKEDYVYIVQAGDTLSGIAQQLYNNGSQPYWMTIYLLNENEIGGDPNVIQPEQPLYLPPIIDPPKPNNFYIAQAGDTLSSIAQQAYNSAEKWQFIYPLNVKVVVDDPNQIIPPGQQLFVPLGLDNIEGGNLHTPCNATWSTCH